MKTLVLGDIHGRRIWEEIVKNETYDRVIFIGDYFDSHEDGVTAAWQIKNFQDICEFKRNSEVPVILLIGNHDYHYFSCIGENGTSGYQRWSSPNINQVIEENKHLMQMAYQIGNILFTHAGVSETFLKDTGAVPKSDDISDYINDLWAYKPHTFQFNGGFNDYCGESITQTPIWIRPKYLMKDSKNLGVIQVVGHTSQNQIDIKGKATGGKYYFIDTLGRNKEYLIIRDFQENGHNKFEFTSNKIQQNVAIKNL
jgi:predicted MPP superfamily phosphohydrolase